VKPLDLRLFSFEKIYNSCVWLQSAENKILKEKE
jgi:hypothetical protein